jgi:hypothetical protein
MDHPHLKPHVLRGKQPTLLPRPSAVLLPTEVLITWQSSSQSAHLVQPKWGIESVGYAADFRRLQEKIEISMKVSSRAYELWEESQDIVRFSDNGDLVHTPRICIREMISCRCHFVRSAGKGGLQQFPVAPHFHLGSFGGTPTLQLLAEPRD